jgi:hypothetical protein
MTSLPSTDIASAPSEIARPKLDQPMGIKTILTFFAIMALGLFFTAYSIHMDLIAVLKASRFGAFLCSTLGWWRSVRISASSEARDRKSPMTTH